MAQESTEGDDFIFECSFCNKSLEANQRRLHKRKQGQDDFYCNLSCKSSHKWQNYRENTPRDLKIRDCDFCKEPFELSKYQRLRLNKGQDLAFCSRSCSSKHSHHIKEIPLSEDFNGRKRQIVCPDSVLCAFCSDTVDLKDNKQRRCSYNKGKRVFFCDRFCFSESRKGKSNLSAIGNTYTKGMVRSYPSINKIVCKNEDCFESIDCEADAYWLGYLVGDGCVRFREPASYTISLGSIDLCTIENFKKYLGSGHKIHKKERSKYSPKHKDFYILSVGSKKIGLDLSKYGVVHNKTFITRFPEDMIPHHLKRHFIRGLIDADGCISYSSKTHISVAFYGTPELLQGCADYLSSELGLKSSGFYLHDTKTVWVYRRSCKQAKIILDHIYEDVKVFLPRKRDKYLEFSNNYSETGKWVK